MAVTDVSQPTSAAGTTSAADAPDPLHNLYRMSRTAGLGSGDYVAINTMSIIALILGAASVSALLFSFLLVLAAGAVVCGVIALVQIRSSNGTQSGRGFAALGIVLGLLFGGLTGGKIVLANAKREAEERKIGHVVKRLSDSLAAEQYGQAYETLFSEAFKRDFTADAFTSRWDTMSSKYGGIESVGWGERADIQGADDADVKRAAAHVTLKLGNFKEPSRFPMYFLYQDGEWTIDAIPDLFEKQKPQDRAPDPTAPLGPEFNPPAPGASPAPAAPSGVQPQAPAQGV